LVPQSEGVLFRNPSPVFSAIRALSAGAPARKANGKSDKRSHAVYPLDIGLIDAHRVRERGRLAIQQRLLRMLHTLHKQLAMTLDRLIGYGLCSLWP
jgi:hypothetical protein